MVRPLSQDISSNLIVLIKTIEVGNEGRVQVRLMKQAHADLGLVVIGVDRPGE